MNLKSIKESIKDAAQAECRRLFEKEAITMSEKYACVLAAYQTEGWDDFALELDAEYQAYYGGEVAA